jgi:pilus assembly protein Flp/PilA
MLFWKNFINEEDGQDLVEYGLVLGLVAAAAVVAVTAFGTSISTAYGSLSSKVSTSSW